MKELLLQYAEYNVWANKLMIDVLVGLGEEQLNTELVSSFPTLKVTTYHCWSAEYVWLQRLQEVSQPVWQQGFTGPFTEACADWEKVSGQLLQYVAELKDDDGAKANCRFADFSGKEHNMPVYQLLHHAFNHATYHRGQLVTMLRQVGVTTIPRTDFVAFAREINP